MKLRDFNFRIWHPNRGYLDNPAYYFCQFEKDRDNICELEIWTGFKDKNGAKIYEGDIVSFKADAFDMGILVFMGEVIFKNGRFVIKGYERMFPHYSFYDFVLKDEGVTIKGNIHENPELLGGKK